jgi:DNA-binding transcriptional ArsR family regulator
MMGKGKRTVTDINNLPDEKCREYLVALSKGLAHPARIEIIHKLANTDRETRCICSDIVNILPLAQSSVSQHLKALKDAGWIEDRIEGINVCYCLRDGVIDYYEALLKRCVQMKGNRRTSRSGTCAKKNEAQVKGDADV